MTRYRKLFATFTLLVAASIPGMAASPVPEGGPTVNTTDGPVRGSVKNEVDTFLGIPYAAPPVGDLRWMPPQPSKQHALLSATEFANTCPQVTTLGAFAGPASVTEDCLYLNVFTTSLDEPKPVIVWIHGGGNITGETNDYEGSKLATGGPDGTPTVVVTINYRLGVLGFLSESHLNAEGHSWGNYGILDIQAALRWVQDNIAAFGGDPNNVTLGGQSAGSRDTTANLLSPMAEGLFHRAINQSSPTPSMAIAEEVLEQGNAFAEAANCSDAACLRGLSAARILQLQGTPNASSPYTVQPFVDGTVISMQPEEAWTSGNYNQMPIMGGSARDEGTFGLSINEYFSGQPQVALTPEEYRTNNSTDVRSQYPLSDYGNNPTLAQDRVNTDPGKCRSLHVLKLQAASNGSNGVYGYDFTYQNAPYYFPQMPNEHDPTGYFQALAAHTIDIQFVFPGYHGGPLGMNLDQTSGQPRELQGDEITLSDQLVAAWTNFAAAGDPNGPGAPEWPAFTPNSPTFLQQDIPNSTEPETEYRTNYKCDFWDAQDDQ